MLDIDKVWTGREFPSAVVVRAVYLQVPRMTVIQTFLCKASGASASYRPVGKNLAW